MKTQVHAQKSFVKLKVLSKRYSLGELLKTSQIQKIGTKAKNRSALLQESHILTGIFELVPEESSFPREARTLNMKRLRILA
jgi:hypothetical protein